MHCDVNSGTPPSEMGRAPKRLRTSSSAVVKPTPSPRTSAVGRSPPAPPSTGAARASARALFAIQYAPPGWEFATTSLGWPHPLVAWRGTTLFLHGRRLLCLSALLVQRRSSSLQRAAQCGGNAPLVRPQAFRSAPIAADRAIPVCEQEPDADALAHAVAVEKARCHASRHQVDPAVCQVVELEAAGRDGCRRAVTQHDNFTLVVGRRWTMRTSSAKERLRHERCSTSTCRLRRSFELFRLVRRGDPAAAAAAPLRTSRSDASAFPDGRALSSRGKNRSTSSSSPVNVDRTTASTSVAVASHGKPCRSSVASQSKRSIPHQLNQLRALASAPRGQPFLI
eukprot:428182-Prymnesium_polylepis.2